MIRVLLFNSYEGTTKAAANRFTTLLIAASLDLVTFVTDADFDYATISAVFIYSLLDAISSPPIELPCLNASDIRAR